MGVNDQPIEINLNDVLPTWIIEDLRKAAEATAAAGKTVGKKVGEGGAYVYDAAKSKVMKEYYGYKADLWHIGSLELDKIRPETEAMIAKSLRDQFAPNNPVAARGIGPSISLPIGKLHLPGDLSVRIWAKDVKDLSKGKAQGVMLNYEVYRF